MLKKRTVCKKRGKERSIIMRGAGFEDPGILKAGVGERAKNWISHSLEQGDAGSSKKKEKLSPGPSLRVALSGKEADLEGKRGGQKRPRGDGVLVEKQCGDQF